MLLYVVDLWKFFKFADLYSTQVKYFLKQPYLQ